MSYVYGAILIDTSTSMREVRNNGKLHAALEAVRPVLSELTVTYAEFPAPSLLEAIERAPSAGPFSHTPTDTRLVVCVSNSHCEDGTSKMLIEQILRDLPKNVFVLLLPVGELEEWATVWFDFLQNNREQLGGKFDVIRTDKGENVREAVQRHAKHFVDQASA